MLTTEERREVIESLLAFVLRASRKNATPTEIAVLPEVARIVLSLSITKS